MNIIDFLRKIGVLRKKKQKARVELISQIDKLAVPVDKLMIGMYVIELDRSWLETHFQFQGFEIENEQVLQELRDTCEFVYIDITRQKNRQQIQDFNSKANDINNNHAFLKKPPPKKLGSVDQEINRADSIYSETHELVKKFMSNAANSETIDAKAAKEVVAECVNSILHSPDAILWFTQLKNKDEYTSQHSLNVCMLSIVFGRHINLTTKELNEVGLCGMMHDMGKMLVPPEVLNKPGKLEPDELLVMQSHTTLGYELLRSSPNMYAGAIETAYNHHERMDGKGYPRRVPAQKISRYTRMVAIADIYDALTSERCYKKGMDHLEAINIMSRASDHLDSEFVVKFIESIGVYPPGTMVKLNGGEIGVVVEVNESSRLRPKIIILKDKNGDDVEERVLDLSQMLRDDNEQLYTIKQTIRAEDYGIDSKIYYQRGIIQKGFPSGH
jgi:HD-GYP domain-containing protein (c-di-GMP phosphodiesterase class II)